MATSFGIPPTVSQTDLLSPGEPIVPVEDLDNPDNPISMKDKNLEQINRANAAMHLEHNKPLLQAAAMVTNPQSTPDDHIHASKVIQNYAGTDEFRAGDFIKALLTGSVGGMVNAATGGSNQLKQAFDQDGNSYVKVVNGRGEVRGYQTMDGERISPDQLKGKFITTPEEIPLAQRAGFVSQNINAKTAAQAQSQNWAADQDSASVAAANASGLQDATSHLREILPKLAKYSVNPATKALIAGIGNMGYGNRKEVDEASREINNVQNGTADNEMKAHLNERLVSLGMGPIKYGENGNITDSTGKQIDWKQITENLKKKSTEHSSYDQVQSNQKQLMDKAQILSANGQLDNLDLIKDAINTQAKAQSHIAQIQATNGGRGLGFIQPNPDMNTGDSFSSLAIANEGNYHYANVAELFSKHVSDIQKKVGPNGAPPIGLINNSILQDPQLQIYRAARDQRITGLQNQLVPINKQVSKGNVSNQLTGVSPPEEKSVEPNPNTQAAIIKSNPNTKITYGSSPISGVKTPDSVKQLYKSGNITREQAKAILQDMDKRGVMQ